MTTQERAVFMTVRDEQCSIRPITKRLCRAPSSIRRGQIKDMQSINIRAHLALLHLDLETAKT